jgi:hypothetical protein
VKHCEGRRRLCRYLRCFTVFGPVYEHAEAVSDRIVSGTLVATVKGRRIDPDSRPLRGRRVGIDSGL